MPDRRRQPPARSRGASAAERVYRALRDDIFEFRLIPGDRFSEGNVASRLNTSRTPVREALYRLRREGYVEVRFRSGWQVQAFDFRQIDELYDLRIALEQAAVLRLCEPGADTGTVRQTLTRLYDLWHQDAATRSAEGATVRERDEQFHCDLVEATGNREMASVHRDVCERLRIVRRLDFLYPTRIQATYAEHTAILDALMNRSPAEAARRLGEHIRASQQAVRAFTAERLRDAARDQQRQQQAGRPA